TEMATLVAVAEEAVPSPRESVPDLPIELEQIVMRALRRESAERYSTAQAMRADLEALIRKQGWQADALALSEYLRALFRDKLSAQEADLRAAGAESLEDFLLSLEDKSDVRWMDPPTLFDQKPPSSAAETMRESKAARQPATVRDESQKRAT